MSERNENRTSRYCFSKAFELENIFTPHTLEIKYNPSIENKKAFVATTTSNKKRKKANAFNLMFNFVQM